MTDSDQLFMSKKEFDTLYTFRAICEQVLDAFGLEDGTRKLYEAFPDNKEWVTSVISDYRKGERITVKLEEPDPDIMRMFG